MDFGDATRLTARLVTRHKSVLVTSDGSVYCDSDIDAVRKHAELHDLELFEIKVPKGTSPSTLKSSKKK